MRRTTVLTYYAENEAHSHSAGPNYAATYFQNFDKLPMIMTCDEWTIFNADDISLTVDRYRLSENNNQNKLTGIKFSLKL